MVLEIFVASLLFFVTAQVSKQVKKTPSPTSYPGHFVSPFLGLLPTFDRARPFVFVKTGKRPYNEAVLAKKKRCALQGCFHFFPWEISWTLLVKACSISAEHQNNVSIVVPMLLRLTLNMFIFCLLSSYKNKNCLSFSFLVRYFSFTQTQSSLFVQW